MANDYKKVISSKKAEAKGLMTDDQVVKCNVAIHTASVAAGAEAFIPIPGVDAVPITATQITMIIALGKIFDQKISESAAKAVIGAAASTFVGRSLVKLIPVAGWAASAAVAAGVTEAIGWTAAVDFANQSSRVELLEADEVDHIVPRDNIIYGEDKSHINLDDLDDLVVDATVVDDETVDSKVDIDTSVDSSDGANNDDPDDESISNDFKKMFGEGDE